MDVPAGQTLVVDDDDALRGVVCSLLRQDGFAALSARSGEEALALLGEKLVDVLLTDLRMPGMDGLDLLRTVQARFPEIPVILMTAHGTVPLAVEAMKRGAADFLLKPFERDELLYAVRKAWTGARHAVREEALERLDGDILGDSPPMLAVKADLARVADTNATVLLRGESGTGKELAARALHARSRRRDRPFVKVLCAALPDALLESELFGYEKGAFTGAATRKPGRVELAEGGTLFLDEIGDVTPAIQVKLLRLLAERTYERLGGTQTLRADVRVVAATHQPLEEMMQRGQFREDLFYRLNVVPIRMPALRERGADRARLLRHFVATLGRSNGRPYPLEPEAEALVLAQEFPGNVRELQNFVERLVLLSDGPTLRRADVERELQRQQETAARPRPATNPNLAPVPAASPAAEGAGALDLGSRVVRAEKDALLDALGRAGGNRTQAARLLGISRRTLYNKLAAFGVG